MTPPTPPAPDAAAVHSRRSTPPPRLQCTLRRGGTVGTTAAAAATTIFALRPDADKTSVYWLDPPPPLPVGAADPGGGGDCAAPLGGCHAVPCGARRRGNPAVPNGGDSSSCTAPSAPPHASCLLRLAVSTDRDSSHDNDDGDGAPRAAVFYVGGFQLVSNAAHIKVSLVPAVAAAAAAASHREDKTKDGGDAVGDCTAAAPTYLTTVRGIKVAASHSNDGTNNDDPAAKANVTLYKALCVIPGGPRPVTAVCLELRPAAKATAAAAAAAAPPPMLSPPLQQQQEQQEAGDDDKSDGWVLRLRHIRWTLRVPPPPPPPQPVPDADTTLHDQQPQAFPAAPPPPPHDSPRRTSSNTSVTPPNFDDGTAVPAERNRPQPRAVVLDEEPLASPNGVAAARQMAALTAAVQALQDTVDRQQRALHVWHARHEASLAALLRKVDDGDRHRAQLNKVDAATCCRCCCRATKAAAAAATTTPQPRDPVWPPQPAGTAAAEADDIGILDDTLERSTLDNY